MVQEGNCLRQKLEGEQERERVTKRKEEEQWGISSQAEQPGDTETNIAITISMVKKAGNASTADSNRTCSDRRSEEDKGCNSASSTKDRRGSTKPICHGCR